MLRDVSFSDCSGTAGGRHRRTDRQRRNRLASASFHGSGTCTAAASRSTVPTSPITHYHGLRTQIGFVLQNTVLFRRTAPPTRYIAFGRPDATDDEIVEAAKLANADEFISRMPDGYASLVGDRGSTLSGGQRQRIGIARALIRDNPILILDEPTAALDAESEHLVIEALERLMAGRTVLTIAHRLSTLRGMRSRSSTSSGGVVVEGTGAQEELFALDGVYAQLRQSAVRPTCFDVPTTAGARERLAPGRTHRSNPASGERCVPNVAPALRSRQTLAFGAVALLASRACPPLVRDLPRQVQS